MSVSTLHTPLNILYTSKDFFENGFTAANKLPKENQTAAIFPQLSFPATCLSFSLELSLKALHLKRGKKKYGHDLRKLFNKLPGDLKDKIHEHLITHDKCQGMISIILKRTNASDYKEGLKKEPYKDIKDEVKRILASHKEAFVDFRYLFEIAEKEKKNADDEWDFNFRSFGNLAYSSIMVCAKELEITLPEL